MTQTTYYEFNKPEGTDLVNPLVDTNPNWDALDADLHEFNERSIANCTEVVALGVHTISRLDTTAKFLKWIATANYTAGETFTVDGLPVAATTPAGATLATNAYVTGSVVLACLNADNTAMTIFVSGTTVASDAERLGGELPSYYATQSDMSDAETDILNLQNQVGNTSIVGIGDGTCTGAIDALNADLSDVKTSNRTLIDTITSFDNTTDHVYDFSEYNRIEFVILGNYTSATNKFHCVFDFLPSTIEIIRADSGNKADNIAPAIVSECVVSGNGGPSAQLTTYVMSAANTFRFLKVTAGGYNITELKIYGLK